MYGKCASCQNKIARSYSLNDGMTLRCWFGFETISKLSIVGREVHQGLYEEARDNSLTGSIGSKRSHTAVISGQNGRKIRKDQRAVGSGQKNGQQGKGSCHCVGNAFCV